MGDVYRATDQNLGREVAIKLLPEEWARDSERLARFGREARLLAALNHPNVATVHGYEELSDRPALVMELVSGETLRDRMGGNPMPIDEIVALFTQIGAGLEAAHEKGIVHRNLKPANVMVTPAGHVIILDFGLARTVSSEQVGAGVSEAPTLAPDVTRSGVVLGTPAYLSPEQARGRAVDRRADLWAFGCMLFEVPPGDKRLAARPCPTRSSRFSNATRISVSYRRRRRQPSARSFGVACRRVQSSDNETREMPRLR